MQELGIFDSVVFGVVQALTEFLPVSSSGHLVIFEHLFGFKEVPLFYNVLLHFATLLVTFYYLRTEVIQILFSVFSKEAKERNQSIKIILLVLVASLPAAIVGLGFKDFIESLFSIKTVGFGLFFTSIVLAVSHFAQKGEAEVNKGTKTDYQLVSEITFIQAFLIGIAQAIAICPGISRSGSTIAIALILGLGAVRSLKFSFLISIPAILGATLLELRNFSEISYDHLFVYFSGFLSTIIVGFFAIKSLVVFTRKSKLIYFSLYTFVLGLCITALF